jgi:TRAP-type C4-dicarboxylate transport system permease large subunit
MVPQMKKEGYDLDYSAAVNITSATTGLIIPPSNILIVYSLARGGVSIGALFVTGYFPRILIGLSLMAVAGLIAYRRRCSLFLEPFCDSGDTFMCVPWELKEHHLETLGVLVCPSRGVCRE